jgi:hypothetical protein
MKVKSAIKSALFATNYGQCYGGKQKVRETPDFSVTLICNRKSILDF